MSLKRPFPALVLTFSVIALACGTSNDDVGASGTADETSTTTQDGDADDAEGIPVELPAAAVVPGAREDVPSALDNISDSSFPTPLIDVSQVRSGGPPPDGIPPIDEPKYDIASNVRFLGDAEPVVALEINGDARAFPLEILTWHELVNTEVGGEPVTVSYCPLCNSAVAYDRTVADRVLDFGTSGSLFNSSLVMYDRQTESLWTHFDGRAVIGALTGVQLESIPIAIVGFGDWRDAHPDGLVLNRDTGVSRDYGTNPYAGYDNPDERPFLFLGDIPDDFSPKARVVGLGEGDTTVVVPRELVETGGVFAAEVGDEPVTIWWKPGSLSALDNDAIQSSRDIGTIATFSPLLDGEELSFTALGDTFTDEATSSTWNIFGEAVEGELLGAQLDAVPHHDTFWFAWIAFHPDAVVVGS